MRMVQSIKQQELKSHYCPLQLFFTPLSQALRLVIHLGEPLPEPHLYIFDLGTLAAFFLLPYLMMMLTNGVGASTGMFVPALAVGATGNASSTGCKPACMLGSGMLGSSALSGLGLLV